MQINTDAYHMSTKIKSKDSRLSKLERELEAAHANKQQQVEVILKDAYELIEQAIARDVPQKIIIDKLNTTYSLKLHPARFRQLLNGERARRRQEGNVIACRACGKPLIANDHVDTPSELERASSDNASPEASE